VTTTPMTRDQAWSLTRYLEGALGARVVQRTDAIEYQIVRGVVETATLNMVDTEDLLENYSQTIGPLIYLAPKHLVDPDLLVSVVVHEMEHVHQWHRDGLRLPWLYLTTQEGRATYEAHAYAAQFEWGRARTGTVPSSIEALGMPLEAPAYLLGKDEIKLAQSLLVQRMTSAAHGHYSGFASRIAIAWAERNAAGLLALGHKRMT